MIALIRISTLILVILIISVFLARGLGYVGSPMSQGYVELKTQLYDDGNVVCWNGICPGQTTFGEAKKLSANRPVLSSIAYGFEIQYSEQIVIQVGNSLGTDAALVDVVSISFVPNYLSLGDLFLLVGSPNLVDGRTRVQLPWQKGICFFHGLSAFFQGTIHRIEPNLSVISLVIGDPAQDSYCSSVEYVRWQGFGNRPFVQ